MKYIVVCSLFFLCYSCNEFSAAPTDASVSGKGRELPKNMVYSYDCIQKDSSDITNILGKADKIIGKVATFNIRVTDEDQMKYGDTFLIQAAKDKNFVIDSSSELMPKLEKILNNLVEARIKPTGIRYKIYLLQDTTTINAYTVGGKVFITTAMIAKCTSDDQLYAIIGHEIGHNEKGHIKTSIKQLIASNRFFGEWGESFVAIKRLLTGSFNRTNELEADYYGLDLSWKLGYDICAIRSFWDAMAKGEERNAINDFFNTHPYSDTRSKCLVSHIKKNFEIDCK
ncbi:MAG: M48 family metalloprotease [Gloeobacteraceae cyanobacterium ES-bin-316]|nr:M48 family metalloprotease [Ferruginibacter sp.]